MKNNPKSAFGSILLATTLLGGHAYMKDATSQVNQILCHKTGTSEIKKGKITVYNEGSCYIDGGNTAFFDEITKIQKQQKFEEVVVYPFYSKPSWKDTKMIIKIDGSQNGTWLSDFYIYQRASGKLENLRTITLEDAIAKVENKI